MISRLCDYSAQSSDSLNYACTLYNKGMKGDKITVTGDDLRISTWVIYFARWFVNVIGGGQHGVIAFPHFGRSNFPCARCEAHAWLRKRIPSCMNKYNCTAVRYHGDAQQLLHTARHKRLETFRCSLLLTLPDIPLLMWGEPGGEAVTKTHLQPRGDIETLLIFWTWTPSILDCWSNDCLLIFWT